VLNFFNIKVFPTVDFAFELVIGFAWVWLFVYMQMYIEVANSRLRNAKC